MIIRAARVACSIARMLAADPGGCLLARDFGLATLKSTGSDGWAVARRGVR
ncbi:hypothetical protein DM49_4143 [Burkholderia mallei]|nr:hypothetical protein DP44_5925 [Burkholderia pseudomallei]KOS76769.1 hypothetical protein DM46_2922 [Burkholderia mallei]KGD51596.1 hypothetical protein DP43_5794 [Burkholderia pseudomallei]KGD58499.1 hypothetical protein DP49_6053 [Burkholderia pseudomallei]KOS95656.1 hypothetical protein DM45_4024 [Burkholderia mallei]